MEKEKGVLRKRLKEEEERREKKKRKRKSRKCGVREGRERVNQRTRAAVIGEGTLAQEEKRDGRLIDNRSWTKGVATKTSDKQLQEITTSLFPINTSHGEVT